MDRMRAAITREPWVDSVVIRRMLPGSISVEIKEKTPSYLVQYQGTLYYADEGGRIIDKVEPGQFVSLPQIEVEAGMFLVEINRGCPYGCRFCAAGYIYRPPRQARLADLERLIEDVSPRKVGLVGTALTDWPDLLPFLAWLRTRKTKFSLASIRADGLSPALMPWTPFGGLDDTER